MDNTKNKINNVLIYPKFKKSEIEKLTVEADNDVSLISHHYAEQFLIAMKNHGIEYHENMVDDFIFLKETMAAVLLRSLGKYHSIQDIVDDMYIPEIDGEEPHEESE